MSVESTEHIRETRVGLVVFSALLILMMAILAIGARKQTFKTQATYLIKFESLNGLDRGSAVRLNGVPVGSVSEVAVPRSLDDRRIVVTISVDHAIRQWIREDSKAKIQSIGVLGDKYVELTLGSKGAKVLPEGREISAVTPLSLDQLLSGSDALIDDLHQMSVRATSVMKKIDEGQGTLGKLVGQDDLHREIAALLADWRKLSNDLGGNLTDAGKQFSEAARKAEAFFSKLQKSRGTVAELIEDPAAYKKLNTFLDEGKDAAQAMKKSFETLHSVLKKIDDGKGSAGKFVNDPSLYREVENVIIGLGKVSLLKKAIQRARDEGEKERESKEKKSAE